VHDIDSKSTIDKKKGKESFLTLRAPETIF
jgi:hypothetical protein